MEACSETALMRTIITGYTLLHSATSSTVATPNFVMNRSTSNRQVSKASIFINGHSLQATTPNPLNVSEAARSVFAFAVDQPPHSPEVENAQNVTNCAMVCPCHDGASTQGLKNVSRR